MRKRGSVAIDLTGCVFKKLVAVSATEKRTKSGSVIWLCRCECGNEVEVSQSDLASGNQVSCGCRKRENNSNIYKQLHLVDGTCIEFLEKRTTRSDNKTGRLGVTMLNGRYRANIGFKGKRYYLGTFNTFEEASQVRERAEEELHGAFLKNYYKQMAQKE